MKKRFTVSIDSEVLKTAKLYAAQKGLDLSALVGDYLKSLCDGSSSNNNFSPKVMRLLGAIELPADFEYKSALEKAIGAANNS